jgi:hypothetical protein
MSGEQIASERASPAMLVRTLHGEYWEHPRIANESPMLTVIVLSTPQHQPRASANNKHLTNLCKQQQTYGEATIRRMILYSTARNKTCLAPWLAALS